jgi:hypothetical protein
VTGLVKFIPLGPKSYGKLRYPTGSFCGFLIFEIFADLQAAYQSSRCPPGASGSGSPYQTGIALLILGSFYYGAPDWDIPISFIMAIFAYLTAPWSMRVLLEGKWRLWPVMLFFTWFTVDGCYAIYWHFKKSSHPQAHA